MRRSDRWYGVTWALMTGALCAWGMLANRLSLMQALATVGCGAVLLLVLWLWRWGEQRAAPRPMSRREWAWEAVQFISWAAVMAGLGWWCVMSGGK